MSDEQETSGELRCAAIYSYNAKDELVAFSQMDPPGTCWEHDEEKRVFRVTEPDGKTTEFHDRAVRFLAVAPDPRTGKLVPVMTWGVPQVMYLCREVGL